MHIHACCRVGAGDANWWKPCEVAMTVYGLASHHIMDLLEDGKVCARSLLLPFLLLCLCLCLHLQACVGGEKK